MLQKLLHTDAFAMLQPNLHKQNAKIYASDRSMNTARQQETAWIAQKSAWQNQMPIATPPNHGDIEFAGDSFQLFNPTLLLSHSPPLP